MQNNYFILYYILTTVTGVCCIKILLTFYNDILACGITNKITVHAIFNITKFMRCNQ